MFHVPRLAHVVGFLAFAAASVAPVLASAAPVTAVCLVAPGTGVCPASPAIVGGVTAGVDFSVELFVDAAVDISAYFVDAIVWAPSDFTLVSLADTSLLGPCTSPPCFQYDDSVPGTLSFLSYFDAGATHSFTGSGALASLIFRPLRSGSLVLDFAGSILFDDSTGLPLPPLTGQGLTVEVEPAIAAVPEPGTMLLVASGLAGAFVRRCRRRRSSLARSMRR